MSDFGTMQSDLALLGMASLVNQDFGSLLNKCQREEVESYEWSFLFTNIIINSTVPYSTGLATALQGSTSISFTGGTIPAWLYTNSWFIRLGATQTTPVALASSLHPTLTLTSPWGANDAISQPFSLFQLYYDVSPLIEVYNVRQIDLLEQSSRGFLNLIDPSRSSTGGNPSLRWAQGPWGGSILVTSPQSITAINNYQIELWPSTSAALPYIVEGKMGPIDMIADTDQPQIPSQVLESKAMMYAARSVFASNGNQKWLQLAQTYEADYNRELDAARTADRKRVVTLGRTNYGGGRTPGVDYLYNHDISGPPYLGR